tara:strand:+ start:713 stop:895 length:183 start_codon:yes stop_codon:yes gene_type:complete
VKDLDFFCTAVKSATTHTGADIWDSCSAVSRSDFTLPTTAEVGFMPSVRPRATQNFCTTE